MTTAAEITDALEILERSRVTTTGLKAGDRIVVPTFTGTDCTGHAPATVTDVTPADETADTWIVATEHGPAFKVAGKYRHLRADGIACKPAKRGTRKPTGHLLPEVTPVASHVDCWANWRTYKASPFPLKRAPRKRTPGERLRSSCPDLDAFLADLMYAGRIHLAGVERDGSAWLVKVHRSSSWETFTTDELYAAASDFASLEPLSIASVA